mgnify:CR=1 FL=1
MSTSPESATEAPETPSIKDGIVKIAKGISETSTKVEKTLFSIANGTNKAAKFILRMEEPDKNIGKEPIILPPEAPIKAVGNLVDATVLNIGRRIYEVASPATAGVWSMGKIFSDPILHPINTLKHPLKYGANWARIITAPLKSAQNAITLQPMAIADALDRATPRINKIPVIGAVTRLTSFIGNRAKKAINWVKSPIEKADDAVAEFQHS